MAASSDRLGWAALLLILLGVASLVMGLDGMAETFAGGYSTTAVGAPAYAALFTTDAGGQNWLTAGTALTALGGAWSLAAQRFPRGIPHWVVGPVLAAGVLALVVGLWRLPFGKYEFGSGPSGSEPVAFSISPPGTAWVLVGAALAALGSLAAVRAAARAGQSRSSGG